MIVDAVRAVLVHIEFLQIYGILIFQDIVIPDCGRTAFQRFIACVPALRFRIGQTLYDLLCRGRAIDAYIEKIIISLIPRIGAGDQAGVSLPLFLIDA
jgi:hypothetical protein